MVEVGGGLSDLSALPFTIQMATALAISGIESATTGRVLAGWPAGTERAGLLLGIGDSRFQDDGNGPLNVPKADVGR